jgi:hypothetical protein
MQAMKSALLCASLSLALAAPTWAQMSRSGCAVVNIADATNILGPGTEQREMGGNCIYGSKDATTAITANLTPDAGTPFNVMKFTSAQNSAIVKDEPTIGEYAFSVTPKEGTGFTIFLLKGNWGATIALSTGNKKATELQKAAMRRLAKSAMSKM